MPSIRLVHVARGFPGGTATSYLQSCVGCCSLSSSVSRRGLRGGGCSVGGALSGHGAMLECLEFMYASSEVIPSPVNVMLSGVVLVNLTALLGAMCFWWYYSCCSGCCSGYFVLSSTNMLLIRKLFL